MSRASAAKRGRNPRFPYVPIIIELDGRTHNTNCKVAYATRVEAIAAAQVWIERAKTLHEAAAAAHKQRHSC